MLRQQCELRRGLRNMASSGYAMPEGGIVETGWGQGDKAVAGKKKTVSNGATVGYEAELWRKSDAVRDSVKKSHPEPADRPKNLL